MGIKPSIYRRIDILKDERVVDMRLAVASIAFYEDVLSPNISAKIMVADVGGSTKIAGSNEPLSLYEGMKIRGGEAVRVEIAPNSDNTVGIDITDKPMYVNSIKTLIREGNKEFFMLNLSSRSGFDNERSFVEKAYSKEGRISDHVSAIYNKFFPYGEIDVDQTTNKYGFIGNLKKPFDVLLNLASKAVPQSIDSAGFFFYETLEKHFFKSLDTLVQQPTKQLIYYAEADTPEIMGGNTDDRIIKYEILRNQSIISDMRRGAYATSRNFFDPVTFDVTDSEFDFTQSQYSEMFTLNDPLDDKDRKLAFDSKSLGEIPSLRLTETFDRGTNTAKEVTTDQTKYIDSYLSQRKVRYNSLFGQVIAVQIASNTNIHAGDIIDCELPKLNGNPQSPQYDYEQMGGRYMVKEVCHYFDSRGSYTSMKLVRDSFGYRNQTS